MTGPLAAHVVSTNSVTETVPMRWGMTLVNNEFDRRHELRVEEAEALKALSPLEMRRNRARGGDGRPSLGSCSTSRGVARAVFCRSSIHQPQVLAALDS